MAAGNVTDVDFPSKIAIAGSDDPIPDDIWQAAVAFSQHDDDGKDPFGPQPKQFMLTPEQLKKRKETIYVRQVASTLRRLKRIHASNHQRQRRNKQRSSPFEKLPTELLLKLMQHTHIENLDNLVNSTKVTRRIAQENNIAVYRGMEIQQYPEWKWFFGDSVQRSPAQSQRLKDALSTDYLFGVDYPEEESIEETLQMVDNNNFIGLGNVDFLQKMQDLMDIEVEALQTYTNMKIARRTATCLWSCGTQRAKIVEVKDRIEGGNWVTFHPIPWEAGSQLIIEQPANIQAEFRLVLGTVVSRFSHSLVDTLWKWTRRHDEYPGIPGKPRGMKKWMSKLVTGVVLEEVFQHLYPCHTKSGSFLAFDSEESFWDIEDVLIWLLNENEDGLEDVLLKVEKSIEFGYAIGLDVEGLFEGTDLGAYADSV